MGITMGRLNEKKERMESSTGNCFIIIVKNIDINSICTKYFDTFISSA